MRLWSLHPQYLDSKGLVALWREALLAQKVLLGETKGYKNHPQLNRFKAAHDPVAALGCYLKGVVTEAKVRQYNFDESKIVKSEFDGLIDVTSGQLAFEVQHLKQKLKIRDVVKLDHLNAVENWAVHPLFNEVKGGVEDWEVI